MPRLTSSIPAAALGMSLLAAPLARAQTLPAASPAPVVHSDPRAVALMTRMFQAYQGLKSYSATETAEGPANMGLPYTLALTYALPGHVNLTVTHGFGGKPMTIHIVSDGTHYFAANSQYPQRYLKTTPPSKSSALEEAMLRSDIKFPMQAILLEHGADWLKGMTDPKSGTRFSLGRPDTADGVAIDTVLEEATGPDDRGRIVFEIGRADHLLRRTDVTESHGGQPETTTTVTFTHVRANPTLTASAFVFTPPPGAVAVAPASDTKADPKAVALMTQMYVAYKALHSFSCAAQVDASLPVRGSHGARETLRQSSSATYAVRKPNLIAFTRSSRMGTASAFCDGKFLYAQTTEDKGGTEEWRARPHYLKKPAPTGAGWNDMLDLARFGGLPEYSISDTRDWVPEVVFGADFMPADGSYGWQVGAPGTLNGDPMDIVTFTQGSSYLGGIPDDSRGTLTLWISPQDHLLRQVRQEWVRPDGTATTTETYTNVQVDPVLPASVFAWTPPKDGLAVDTPDALIPPRPAIGPTLRAGDAAPSLAFGMTDTGGNPVTLAAYRGKVLVLDFWATWCGPCRRQMPALVAAYKTGHARGLEVIGYALEQSKDRAKLPAYTQAHGMAWRQVWDHDGIVANAAAARGIPFAVVIGRDGKVAAVGNPGEDLDLPAAVSAALAKP